MKNSSKDIAEVPGDHTIIEYIPEIPYYETPPSKIHVPPPFPDPAASQPPGVPVVRAEEAFIVIFVLVLWVAAIALFINRWGKIRMLEPYQPKFHQEHRPSCPMIDNIGHPSQHRTSFSKFNACHDPPIFANIAPTYRSLLRPRQNSVFVGSSNTMLAIHMNPPRKTKSAVDIQSLVKNEPRPSLTSKSMLPMTLVAERRLSTTPLSKERRPSCSTGFLSPRPFDNRRPSASSEFMAKDRLSCNDYLSPLPGIGRRTSSTGEYLTLSMASKEHRRPSFNNVIAQVTSERRPSSSMLRISNV